MQRSAGRWRGTEAETSGERGWMWGQGVALQGFKTEEARGGGS